MLNRLQRLFGNKDTSEFPFEIKKVEVTIHVGDAKDQAVIDFFKTVDDMGITFSGNFIRPPYIYRPLHREEHSNMFLTITDAEKDDEG